MLHNGRSNFSFLESLESRRLFAAGDVDTAFGTNGLVLQTFDHGYVHVNDAQVVGGNKFLVAGTLPIQSHHSPNYQSYFFQQYNADGTLDSSFGTGGMATGSFIIQSEIQRFTMTAGGKIDAIVYETNGGKREYHLLAQFNSDGSVDTTFGNNGFVQVTTDVRDNSDFYRIAIDGNGKILVGWENAVRRYNSDGTIDTTFGTNGEVDNIFSKTELSESLAVLSSGKIVVGGTTSFALTQSDETALVAQLNSDGTIDTSFGTQGIATVNFVPNDPQAPEGAMDLGEALGGKILVAGLGGGFASARLGANGQLDATYGTNGISIIAQARSTYAARIILDGQNRIYLIDNLGAAVRLTSDGALDDTFGRVIVDDESKVAFGSSSGVAGLLSDGRLVFAGEPLQLPRQSGIELIARLTADDGNPSPVTLANRILSVTGTSGDDTVTLSEGTGVVRATLNGFGREFDTSDVDVVSATGGDGNDRLDATRLLSVPASLSGGNGIDRINGGPKGDTIQGNGGRDFIDGGLGADLISGGGGNDQIRGQGGADHLFGGPGNDYLEGDGGNDQLTGGAGTDVMHGNAGDDTFFAADGEVDSLFGDGGSDTATVDNDDMLTSIETTH